MNIYFDIIDQSNPVLRASVVLSNASDFLLTLELIETEFETYRETAHKQKLFK